MSEVASLDAKREERLRRTERIRFQHHWLYKMYGFEGEILYVGITCHGTGRFLQHAKEKDWWPKVSNIEIEHFDTRDAVLSREAELIHELEPPFNLAIPTYHPKEDTR